MSWKFDYRIVRGWGVSGLFDDKGNMILGAPGLQVPTGEYKRQIETAPEMRRVLAMFLEYNDQGAPLYFDTDAMWRQAREVVAKIEGGGE